MIQHNYNGNVTMPHSTYTCPIARIEAERKVSPMAMLVAKTTSQPTFA